MGTVKPKLQGYVREDLFNQFEDERRALGLSQSQVLEKILLERYGGDDVYPPNRESLYWITKSLEDLQERVKKLEITGNPDSNSLGNLDSNLESDLLSNLDRKSKLAKGLGQRALAKRLGCSYQTLGDLTIIGNGNIEDWSKRQDPQSIGWELRDKKYYPCNL